MAAVAASVALYLCARVLRRRPRPRHHVHTQEQVQRDVLALKLSHEQKRMERERGER